MNAVGEEPNVPEGGLTDAPVPLRYGRVAGLIVVVGYSGEVIVTLGAIGVPEAVENNEDGDGEATAEEEPPEEAPIPSQRKATELKSTRPIHNSSNPPDP